jgi:antitoxin component of MazEF toxin-antitoxin module
MVVIKKKIIRIGNSLGIRLPKEALTICGLKEGDEVELQVESKNINILLKKK